MKKYLVADYTVAYLTLLSGLSIAAVAIYYSVLPLITCPYCGLEGRANMQRWHFDNCKEKA